MEENTNVKIRLVSIEDEQLISKIDDFAFESLDESKLEFHYKLDTVVKISKNTISVIPGIRYSYEKHALLEVSATFNYFISNLESVVSVDEENHRINVKADIFPSIVGSSYASLRGLVYARAATTFLAKYPLPMIEVKTLVEKNGISIEE